MRESRLWLLFLFSGPLLFLFLGIHLFFMHLDGILDFWGIKTGQVLEYTAVIQRAADLNWVLLYLFLLLLSLYHGLYGLRSVLLELSPKEKVINRTLLAVGLLALIGGVYVVIKSVAIGTNFS